ncbi:hypothetical protein SAMN02746089_00241 [Caldanaerobius fijiensis DSM 17918]|uniref:DUF503 domain-containing protein n=1 Tax=Caldanaerobius fijiensis DSM 17918 TaxID=1121256 RepID=A0A1M4T813_9THEO|nr:DUF503 domain-containing protein [Caldanaerobius fijiensis]SHE40619.1 hypothetical protein SAMN02746089_00241 [Caldanaerobius fijiensis DSM 17918]
MYVGTIKIYLVANWVHSLKEKRMIIKSLASKVRNKFNVSIAEIGNQDLHQSIVLGIACIGSDYVYADNIIEDVLNFIEKSTDAYVSNVEKEIISL